MPTNDAPESGSEYLVKSGECVESIAFDRGLDPETIWNHPNNETLKEQRGDRGVLLPGDPLYLPPREHKSEAVALDAENVFVVRRPLRRVRLQLVRAAASEPEGQESLSPELHEDHATTKAPAEEPWANACVEIKSGSRTWKTQADEDGWIDLRIPMSARQAILMVAPGCEEARQFQLDFGILDPLTEFRGVLQRLRNLGYPAVERSEWTPELRGVLADFQRDHGLSSSGELDDETRDKLRTMHGS